MSRAREIVGQDDRGRPITRWADAPELEQGLPVNPPGPIERRYVEPATDLPQGKPALGSREHLQQSRMRGAKRHVEITASRRHPWGLPQPAPEPSPPVQEEEPPMTTEPTLTGLEATGEVIPDQLVERLDRLQRRAEQATRAYEQRVATQVAAEVAEAAWQEARELLERAVAEAGIGPTITVHATSHPPIDVGAALDRLTGGGPVEARGDSGADHAETIPVAEPPPPPSDGELAEAPAAEDPDASRLTGFQQRVLAKTIQYGGDRRRVANEEKVSIESVEGTLERIGAKGLLPPTLIPLLPARYAKYARVPR